MTDDYRVAKVLEYPSSEDITPNTIYLKLSADGTGEIAISNKAGHSIVVFSSTDTATKEYKILAQSLPDIQELEDIYVVPAGRQAVLSSIVMCNQHNTASSFSLAVVRDQETLNQKSYIYYQFPLTGNQTQVIKAGLTLSALDKLVAITSGDVSINVFGNLI